MKLFIKRFLLIIIGIILSLVLLECGLRVAGWAIFSYQQYKNNKALKNKSQYTIMCLGESTTAGKYPIQLQQVLDKKYPNKFSVIDCGIIGITLETILDSLDNNINKYNPDFVICMMGINNKLTSDNTNNSVYKESDLKIYNLFILIKTHINHLLNQHITPTEEKVSDKISTPLEQAFILEDEGKYKEAEQLLKEILQNNPNDERCLFELASLYSNCMNEREIAYNMAKDAINRSTCFNKRIYYQIIIQFCFFTNKIDSLMYYTNRAINENIAFSPETYYCIKNYVTDKQRDEILKLMTNHLEPDKIFGLLAITALEQKDYNKAEKYFDMLDEAMLTLPNLTTYNLYKLILKKLIGNNIKVICMQYPVRSIKPLQNQLQNEPYYDKITFISNEKLFKDALIKHKFEDLFIDQFGGDFGHCKYLGDLMIAENVVNTLEKILDLKNNK